MPNHRRLDRLPETVMFADGSGATVTFAELTGLAEMMRGHPALAGVERVTIIGRQSLRLVSVIVATHLVGREFAVVDASEAPEIQRAHVAAFRSGAVIDLSAGSELVVDRTPGIPELRQKLSEHAYTVRTSGTTGTPKLVQLARTAFDQYVEQFAARYDLGAESRLAVWAAPTYDAHHCQMFSALVSGAVGVVAGPDVRRGGRSVLQWLRAARVTHFETTPSILRSLVAAAVEDGDGLPADLTHIMCSGERFEPALARAVAELAGPLGERIRLTNEFGPTECVLATWHEVTTDDLDLPDLPLGVPIPGRTIEVRPPAGGDVASRRRPGEIVIRSRYLCAGYGVADARTGSPFPVDEDGVGTFRTGDLGYVDDRGLLRLQGRRDRMVKRRGVKVDLDDVERAFRAIPHVVDAAALADTGPDDTPVVWVWVVSRDAGRTEDDVRADVMPHLAAASVPEHVVLVDALPRLHSGKVDYRTLPRHTSAGHDAATATTETEAGVVEEFTRVLGVAVTSPDANFFVLGGHSLLALDLNEGLTRRFNVDIDLHDVLRNPRASALAMIIDQRRTAERPRHAVSADHVGFDLTAAERPIWAWTQLFPHDGSANVVAGFRTTTAVSDHEITNVLDQLVRDTAQLRLNYRDDGGHPVRVVCPARPVEVRNVVVDGPVDDCGQPEVRCALYRPFDIAAEQLVRAVVVRTPHSAELSICLVVHHIMCDGVGLATLVTDLRRRLLHGTAAGPTVEPATFPVLKRADAAGHWRQVRDQLRATPRSSALRDHTARPEPGIERFTVTASTAHTVAAHEDLPLSAVLIEFVAQALLEVLGTDAVVVETPVSLRAPAQARAIGNYVVDVPIVVGRTTQDSRRERRKAVAADLLDAIEAAHTTPGFGVVRPGQGLAPVGDAVIVLEHATATEDSGATTPVLVPGSPPRNPLAFYLVAGGSRFDCRVLSRVVPALAQDITTEFRKLTAGSTTTPVGQESQWQRM